MPDGAEIRPTHQCPELTQHGDFFKRFHKRDGSFVWKLMGYDDEGGIQLSDVDAISCMACSIDLEKDYQEKMKPKELKMPDWSPETGC